MSIVSELSILIPVYNHVCVKLVSDLHHQAERCKGLRYEILVSDDGSTDPAVVSANRMIDTLPCCRYLRRDINAGRAATRNLLAHSAHYTHLLFIDSHMSVLSSDYLSRYLSHPSEGVVYGGYTVPAGRDDLRDNLRYRYEASRHHVISLEERQSHPYHDFHTSNFMIQREVILRVPFDERFRRYGYEDVFFGKQLEMSHVDILHIDNPVGFADYESNERFLTKTREGLRTLWEMRSEVTGYSRMLSRSERLNRFHLGGRINGL